MYGIYYVLSALIHVLSQTRHVMGMDANYGGTEIRAAVQHVLANRGRTRPTSFFVLTDGEVSKEICLEPE